MKLIAILFPRLRRQEDDIRSSAEQQVEVVRSLAEARQRLRTGRLAVLDAQVRARDGGERAE